MGKTGLGPKESLRQENYFIGLGKPVRLQYYNMPAMSRGGMLETEKKYRDNGSSSVGLAALPSPGMRRDKRSPIRGRGFLFWCPPIPTYSKSLGGTVNYHRTYIDFAQITSTSNPRKRQIFAMELFGNFVRGGLRPLKSWAELGGPANNAWLLPRSASAIIIWPPFRQNTAYRYNQRDRYGCLCRELGKSL